RFPDLVADDLFLDSQFSEDEKCVVAEAASRVATPRRTWDLIRRLVRVRAGNAALRARGAGIRAADRFSWLRDVVVPRPWLAGAAACYVAITLIAAVLARRRSVADSWGRDESEAARGVWHPLVSVITVSSQTRDRTRRCLAGRRASCRQVPYEVIVVDNASTAGSADAVAGTAREVKLLRMPENVGFGRA